MENFQRGQDVEVKPVTGRYKNNNLIMGAG